MTDPRRRGTGRRILAAALALASGLALAPSARSTGLTMATEPVPALPSAPVAPPPAAIQQVAPSVPLTAAPEHRRTPDQTFLTFPEWFLVHSPAEYAGYLSTGAPPSAFPLFAHIAQFWQGYAAINHEILGKYPFNGGYHLMIVVIGTSTTVEYTLKGLYEHTIGRLAEATTSGPDRVPEERFAAAYAQRYVDFIRIDPWYLFDFGAELHTLWSDAPVSGPNLFRRWERRFLLTTELLVKDGYARAIRFATHSLYESPKLVTAVVLSAAPPPDPVAHPDVVVLQSNGTAVLATVPRYEAFTTYARWLAARRIDFREIAGNDGEVLVSLLVPNDWTPGPAARLLFEQPVITVPGTKRAVVAVRIARLGALLRDVDRPPGIRVEHIYDF
jgi:hypothetical protein